MPRSNRRLYRTSGKHKKGGTTASTDASSAPQSPPPAQPAASSPPPSSFGAALAHGVASGVGWGVGTSAIKAALGLGGEAVAPAVTNATATTTTTPPPPPPPTSLPHDACGTLWVAYQRCLYDSGGGRACDPVKQGFDAVCPGFQAPLEGVVREATTPAFPLSLPPL